MKIVILSCKEFTKAKNLKKGRLKNDSFWYRYIYPKNLNLFRNEKLVAPEISHGGNFSYDKNGEFYSTTTVYGYIKKNDVFENYKTLMALLNSQLFWWYLVNTGTVLANNYFRFKPNYIFPFPLPILSIKEDEKLTLLVDEILLSKQQYPAVKTTELELKINAFIFELYDLTQEEIDVINTV